MNYNKVQLQNVLFNSANDVDSLRSLVDDLMACAGVTGRLAIAIELRRQIASIAERMKKYADDK